MAEYSAGADDGHVALFVDIFMHVERFLCRKAVVWLLFLSQSPQCCSKSTCCLSFLQVISLERSRSTVGRGYSRRSV